MAAGRRNQRKRGSLSPAGRERLRQSTLAHRPWERSTGPTSPAGKARSALNGYSQGKGSSCDQNCLAELVGVQRLINQMTKSRRQATRQSGSSTK